MTKKLNARQQYFVEQYVLTGNATKSAIAAGYSQRSASSIGERLLRKDELAAAVAASQSDLLERVMVDQDMVIAGLLKEATREGDGASHSARVNAWMQLGKHLQMFTDKHDRALVEIQLAAGESARVKLAAVLGVSSTRLDQ
jgi:phage terminase small subunit